MCGTQRWQSATEMKKPLGLKAGTLQQWTMENNIQRRQHKLLEITRWNLFGGIPTQNPRQHISPLFRHEEVRDLLWAVATLTTQTYNNISTSNNMPSHFFFKQQHCPSFEKEYQVSCWINWGSLIIFSTLSEPVNHLHKYIQLVWSSKILNTCNSQTSETWPTHKGTHSISQVWNYMYCV